jgi:hypothetical protein
LLSDVLIVPQPIDASTEMSSLLVKDYNLDEQYFQMVTGSPTGRIIVSMYNTTTSIPLKEITNTKQKLFYLIQEYGSNALIIQDDDNSLVQSNNYSLCSTLPWEFGIDGNSVSFKG